MNAGGSRRPGAQLLEAFLGADLCGLKLGTAAGKYPLGMVRTHVEELGRAWWQAPARSNPAALIRLRLTNLSCRSHNLFRLPGNPLSDRHVIHLLETPAHFDSNGFPKLLVDLFDRC